MPKSAELSKLVDGPPVLGMNTKDDPLALRDGQCVKLTNAFPGNPPLPRRGCVLEIVPGSLAVTPVCPAIIVNVAGVKYIAQWVYRSDITSYCLIYMNVADPETFGGMSPFATLAFPARFGFEQAFDCVYAVNWVRWATWNTYALALQSKVVFSDQSTSDFYIEQAAASSGATAAANAGGCEPDKYVEVAYTYIRRTDSAARCDTYLPGSIPGSEDVDNRRVVLAATQAIDPTSTMLTNSGLGGYNAAQLIDNNTGTKGFDVDAAAAGAYLKIDYGSGQTRCVRSVLLYTDGSGSTASFKIQYSNNGTDWVDTDAVAFIPALAGWNTQAVLNYGDHRYWRILLNNTPGAGPDFMELEVNGAASILHDLSGSHATATAQGATHVRVYHTLGQDSAVAAQGATKYWAADLPLSGTHYVGLSDAELEALGITMTEQNYAAPPACGNIKYHKGRMWLFGSYLRPGIGYYSESIGGDGGVPLDIAIANPQRWASLFNPLTYFVDCEEGDIQVDTGLESLGSDLYFFRERKIFALYGGDPDSGAPQAITKDVGCILKNTITKAHIIGKGECILFLSNHGPARLMAGGTVEIVDGFTIKELWPEARGNIQELFSEIRDHYDEISNRCSSCYGFNTWWITYYTHEGNQRIFGMYFGDGTQSATGPLEVTLPQGDA